MPVLAEAVGRLWLSNLVVVSPSTKTLPIDLPASVEVVSVAPLFGEAIRRIHDKESISVLFS